MRYGSTCDVIIRPAVPTARLESLREALNAALEENRIGEVSGKGGPANAMESTVAINVSDFASALPVIRQVLQRYELAKSSLIVSHGEIS